MVTTTVPHLDDCIRPFAGAIAAFVLGGAVAGLVMLWSSVVQFRRKRLGRAALVVVVVVIGVALVPWAAWQVASEPVLVSGRLNRGSMIGLALFSVWLAFLAARARHRGPTQSAVLFCYGGAIMLGATAGWTWRALQPCKHHPAVVVRQPDRSNLPPPLTPMASYTFLCGTCFGLRRRPLDMPAFTRPPNYPHCCGKPMKMLGSRVHAEAASKLTREERRRWVTSGMHVVRRPGRRWTAALTPRQLAAAREQTDSFARQFERD